MELRTIEKRKDWIWIGFQSGPPLFARTIEKWLYCTAGNFRHLKMPSTQLSGSSSGIYFRQTSAVACLLFGRSVIALLLIVYLQIHESSWCHTCGFVEKFSQQFSQKNSLTKATKLNSWRKFPTIPYVFSRLSFFVSVVLSTLAVSFCKKYPVFFFN